MSRIFLLVMIGIAAQAQSSGGTSRVILALVFENQPSKTSLEEIKRELRLLFKPAGVVVAFEEGTDGLEDPVRVWVHLNGSCRADNDSGLEGKSPLGATDVVEGRVQRTTRINCDRVRHAVRANRPDTHSVLMPILFGRAVARIVAHEVYHILVNTGTHGHSGVARASLSGEDLMQFHFGFDRAEIKSLRTAPLLYSGRPRKPADETARDAAYRTASGSP